MSTGAEKTNTLLGREKNLIEHFFRTYSSGTAAPRHCYIRTITQNRLMPVCVAIDSPVLGIYSLQQYSSGKCSRCAARGTVSRNKYPDTNRNPAASALRARWKSCKNLLFYPPTKRMGENEKEKLARRGESSEKDFRRPALSPNSNIRECDGVRAVLARAQ